MSSREPFPPTSGQTCEQLLFVSRLALDNPLGLRREPWLTHLRACDVCRNEAEGHARSLAVFRMVERERLEGEGSALTWEDLARSIEQEEAVAEYSGPFRAWWAIPAVAVTAGALVVTVMVGWEGYEQGGDPAPARIVRVQPQEQRSMEQVVRWTLESGEPGTDPLRIRTQVDGEFDSNSTEVAGLEGRELAASVSTQPDAAGLSQERPVRPTNATGVGAISDRRPALPPTQPASNRIGRGQPLFRLEHHLAPIQPVSYLDHD